MGGEELGNAKENAFDFLRLFAALTVVVAHSVEHLELPFLWHHFKDRLWFFDGVPMFFILSGLLVYRSCEKSIINQRPVHQYFINRILRIVPGIYFYVLITAISFLAFGVIPIEKLGSVSFLAWFISTIILVPVYHPPLFSDFGVGVVNGSLWTIPAEFGFYIILPAIVLLARRTSFKIMLTILFVVAIINIALFNHFTAAFKSSEPTWFKIYGITFLPYLLYFGLGMFWSRAWEKVKQSGVIALMCLMAYVLIRYDLLFHRDTLGPLWTVAWAVPFSYSLIWFGYNAPNFLNRLTDKIGDLSYGVYIWHMIVINYFIYFNLPERLQAVGGSLINGIVIAVSLLLSAISWWMIERNALKLKPYSSRSAQEKESRKESLNVAQQAS
jgi:peptidoglycan/LPS O-acetylase OafA/YrhL